jgi:excisionase family DNA binding protein
MKKTGEIVTAAQAAAEKGCSRQAVSQAIAAGRLKGERWGRFYVIRREDLDQWEPRRMPAAGPGEP